ncbi:hypothetical protein PDESU_01189 [Pontiella desulfatans]|uniref:Uncharacterized protein n=1 Tax=Pontiella desulfatans TaxID=2750659 RepID=A0A6C2TZN7_PONDE|nr:hypothetical protein [Pontiella desulfatans]VGO12636.1 hypothetical protein PDESU_01189 [Pontiella desulfatans]
MGLNINSPFSGRKANIDVPATVDQPGSVQDDPSESAELESIEVKPATLGNLLPSTQG